MSWIFNRGPRRPEDKFADEMTDLVKSLLGMKATLAPDFALTIENPSGGPLTMNLANIFMEAQRLTGEDRTNRLRTAVLAMKPEPRPETWEAAAPRLMPAIRPVSWISAAGVAGVIHRSLAPFVIEACALDSQHGMTFVTDKDLAGWAAEPEQAMETASANLAKRSVQVGRAGPVAIVMEPDGYISSWLAAPSKLRAIANDVGREVVALAPARDQLLLVDVSHPSVALKVLEDMLVEYQQAPRQLSPVPYLVGETGIQTWRPAAGHPARPAVDRARRILANVEYGLQRTTLQDALTRAGEDVYVAKYSLMQRQDGSTYSWAAWVKQVTNGLVPQVDLLQVADNDSREAGFVVRWTDALKVAGHALVREPAIDPPRWRYRGWPDAATFQALRATAVPVPTPREYTDESDLP